MSNTFTEILIMRETIDQLIEEVMPVLQSFVAGRRPIEKGMVGLNEKIAFLRDIIEGYGGSDKQAIQSIQVHGRNLGGALLSSFEKIGIRGLSTTLADAIKRYDEVVLEGEKPDYTKLVEKYIVDGAIKRYDEVVLEGEKPNYTDTQTLTRVNGLLSWNVQCVQKHHYRQ